MSLIHNPPWTDAVNNVNDQLAAQGMNHEWHAVAADDYTLQVDIDEPEGDVDGLGLALLYQRIGQDYIHIVRHKSRSGNTHAVLTLPKKMDVTERIAWQTILGSDPVREAANLVSVHNNVRNPVLLVMRKQFLLTNGEQVATQTISG